MEKEYLLITVQEARKMFGFLPAILLRPMWIAESSGINSFLVEKEMLQDIRYKWNNYYYNL